MQSFDWKEKYAHLIRSSREAMKMINPGDRIFIGTGCGQPQHLVSALVEYGDHIYDAHVIHLLTMGAAHPKFREKFKMNSFFIAENVRGALDEGVGDYTPIFLSDIPRQFESGRISLDVALISVTAPDVNGLCSLGISVDIVKAAAANCKYVIAQVNQRMPRTLGNSFIHVNSLDAMVPDRADSAGHGGISAREEGTGHPYGDVRGLDYRTGGMRGGDLFQKDHQQRACGSQFLHGFPGPVRLYR
jgi:acyl-CoA hydrolase